MAPEKLSPNGHNGASTELAGITVDKPAVRAPQKTVVGGEYTCDEVRGLPLRLIEGRAARRGRGAHLYAPRPRPRRLDKSNEPLLNVKNS